METMFTIKQARRHAGLSQAEAAKALEMTFYAYTQLEKDPDRITVAQLLRLSTITGIPASSIFLPSISSNIDTKATV